MKVRRHNLVTITVLLLAGFFIRVWNLSHHPLSGDEAFSVVNWLQGDLAFLLTEIAVIDPQPPVALLTFYGWTKLLGESEFAIRVISVFASMIVLASAYRIGTHLIERRFGAFAAVLTLFAMQQVWNAQDARQYALWMGLSAFNVVILLHARNKPTRLSNWLLFGFTSALAFHAYYLEAFMLCAHHLLLLYEVTKKHVKVLHWFASMGVTALLTIPWLLQPHLLNSSYSPTGGAPKPFEAVIRYFFGPTFPPERLYPTLTDALAMGVFLSAIVFVGIRSRKRATFWLIACATFPIVLLSLFTTITGGGYFRSRYTVAGGLPALLILSAACWLLLSANSRRVRTLGVIVVGGFLALNLFAYHTYFSNTDYAKAPPWREISATLQQKVAPNDVIVRNIPGPAYDYYISPTLTDTIVPQQRGAPISETDAYLAQLLNRQTYLWFMPVVGVWDQDQVAYSYLIDNAQLISDRWLGVTRIMQFTAYDSVPQPPEQMIDAVFGSVVSLQGFTITQTYQPSSQPQFVVLMWRPVSVSDQPLTMFLHLIEASSGQLVAQDDHPPQQGRLNPSAWHTDRPYQDVYLLPAVSAITPSNYQLRVGVYNSETGERLLTEQGEDSVLLTDVKIE